MREPKKIILSSAQMDYADNTACRRRAQGFVLNRTPRNGATGSFDTVFAFERLGTRTEHAAKVYLNPIRWYDYVEASADVHNLPDLETLNGCVKIDVKGRALTKYDLPVQKNANPNWAYLLVTAENPPEFLIWGWLWGHEAMKPEYWLDPAGQKPAYFVKKGLLRDYEELLALCASHNIGA